VTRTQGLLANVSLVVASLAVCLGLAEAALAFIDWLHPRWILDTSGTSSTGPHLDEVPLTSGVSRDLFFVDPAPLPNRTKPPQEWIELDHQLQKASQGATAADGFKQWDMWKAWNAVFVGDPCQNRHLRGAPGRLFVYDPPDGNPRPPFRYLPKTTTPMGLTTNDFGWRGPPVAFRRAPNTVRIVFVGASTTAEAQGYPFSGPEHVGAWLDRWAADKKLDVKFEVLNAGRESLRSADIAAVVQQEVIPLHPDLVFHYEGNLDLDLSTIVINESPGMPRPAGLLANWLRGLSPYLRTAERAQGLLEVGEWPKPAYTIHWPLDERDPDLTRFDLPLKLSSTLHNFDTMREGLGAVHSELVLSSFHWLAKRGLILNGLRNAAAIEELNVRWFPYHYADLERATAFENRVFARYASLHSLPFIDVAGYMPYDPDLFTDATHNTPFGVRLRAWIVFQQLVPIIENRLSSQAWPRPMQTMDDSHPAFRTAPHLMEFSCKPN
jgi:hypothetical protein